MARSRVSDESIHDWGRANAGGLPAARSQTSVRPNVERVAAHKEKPWVRNLIRRAAVSIEAPFFGPVYAWLQYRIRTPEPLDPEANWRAITETRGPAIQMLEHVPPAFIRKFYVDFKLRLDHIVGISAHYDVSNDFYRLFLDQKYMFYSCADFVTGNETIEEAQTNKANDFVRRLEPKPGEKILDLGCGWGAMLQRIYEETGDRENLKGMSLSREQVAFNSEQRGFDVDFDNFITREYTPESYDKIYSIGAWEHVRPKEIPQLLRKLFNALRPGGRLVQQFICLPSWGITSYGPTGQIFFPGSMLASYKYQIESAERAGFNIGEQTIHDYRPTLRAWHARLAENRERAIELVGIRTWNKFLVFFPAAHRFFDDHNGFVLRITMSKPAR